jgi:hypothetical protein
LFKVPCSRFKIKFRKRGELRKIQKLFAIKSGSQNLV